MAGVGCKHLMRTTPQDLDKEGQSATFLNVLPCVMPWTNKRQYYPILSTESWLMIHSARVCPRIERGAVTKLNMSIISHWGENLALLSLKLKIMNSSHGIRIFPAERPRDGPLISTVLCSAQPIELSKLSRQYTKVL